MSKEITPKAKARMAKVDRMLEKWLPKIEAKQEEFFSNNGYYWQGVKTPAEPVDGDGDTDSDRKASDMASWKDQRIGLPRKLDGAVSISSYQNKKGCGYAVYIEIKTRDGIYHKTINYGNETSRQQDWQLLPTLTDGVTS